MTSTPSAVAWLMADSSHEPTQVEPEGRFSQALRSPPMSLARSKFWRAPLRFTTRSSSRSTIS